MGKQCDSNPKRFRAGYQILSSITLKELLQLQTSSYKQAVLTSSDTSGSLVFEEFQSCFPIPSLPGQHFQSLPVPNWQQWAMRWLTTCIRARWSALCPLLKWIWSWDTNDCLFPSENKISPLTSHTLHIIELFSYNCVKIG